MSIAEAWGVRGAGVVVTLRLNMVLSAGLDLSFCNRAKPSRGLIIQRNCPYPKPQTLTAVPIPISIRIP